MQMMISSSRAEDCMSLEQHPPLQDCKHDDNKRQRLAVAAVGMTTAAPLFPPSERISERLQTHSSNPQHINYLPLNVCKSAVSPHALIVNKCNAHILHDMS